MLRVSSSCFCQHKSGALTQGTPSTDALGSSEPQNLPGICKTLEAELEEGAESQHREIICVHSWDAGELTQDLLAPLCCMFNWNLFHCTGLC